MKFIILTFFYILISGVSLKTKPKFCINCKFAINNVVNDNNKFLKCSLFTINEELNDSIFLVTGVNYISEQEPNYIYCSTARKFNNMCGKEGKMYKKNI